MIDAIDNFFRWLRSATFVSDLIIRLVAIVIVGGIAVVGWFISIPLLAWYFYKKFGNARISGCRCSNCNKMNDCNDKFCIGCGSPMGMTEKKQNYSEPNTSSDCRCDNCNSLNDCDDKFCTNCGSKLNHRNSQQYDEILNSIDGIVVALLAKVAKADGKISTEEAKYLSSVFDLLAEKRNNSEEAKEIYKKILKEEKNRTDNIDEYCQKISYSNAPKDLKIEVVKIFMELAYIDGVYDKNEENIIVKIVHHLDIDFSIYQNIKESFEPNNKNQSSSSNINLSLKECYEVLESNESDIIDTIKKNYRRLVKHYHYDSMAAKNLPPDMLKFAEEKTKTLNEAYEKIKKSRG